MKQRRYGFSVDKLESACCQYFLAVLVNDLDVYLIVGKGKNQFTSIFVCQAVGLVIPEVPECR